MKSHTPNRKLAEKIAAQAVEIKRLHNELSLVRRGHADLARGIKTVLGFKNWPNRSGPFCEVVAELVKERIEQNAKPRKGRKGRK